MAPDSRAEPSPFPSTLWSQILSVGDPGSPEYRLRMDELIRRYWKPVYHTIRSGWTKAEEEARDLTQEFFVEILDGQLVGAADPSRGSFRHYLRGALRHFLLNVRRAERAEKRGGALHRLSLDFEGAGATLEPADTREDPEARFDRAWAYQLMSEATAELQGRLSSGGRATDWAFFKAYDLPAGARPSCRELGEKYSVPEHQVRRTLEAVRQELRAILLERVRAYVRDEAELYRELDELF